MSEESLITPEIEAMVGTERIFEGREEIGRALIRRFALSVDSMNPLYQDEKFASKSRYRGIIAPPTMIFELNHSIGAEIGEDGTPEEAFGRLPPPFTTVIRGGNEYEFHQPVRPDDVVTARQKIVQIYERQGKTGPLGFVVNELTYYNQHGEKLGLNRETVICPYKKPEDTEASK